MHSSPLTAKNPATNRTCVPPCDEAQSADEFSGSPPDYPIPQHVSEEPFLALGLDTAARQPMLALPHRRRWQASERLALDTYQRQVRRVRTQRRLDQATQVDEEAAAGELLAWLHSLGLGETQQRVQSHLQSLNECSLACDRGLTQFRARRNAPYKLESARRDDHGSVWEVVYRFTTVLIAA